MALALLRLSIGDIVESDSPGNMLLQFLRWNCLTLIAGSKLEKAPCHEIITRCRPRIKQLL